MAVSLSEQASSEIRPILPPTIQALLAARLQRLGPGASSVLARAAIIGEDFGARAVRELLPLEARGPLTGNLQTLVAKGLVQHGPPDPSPEEEYSCHHILLQQAAYRAIPKSLRAELHHRYADWLEYVAWEPATQRTEILGYHLEQSIRYLNEPRPAEAQSSPLPRRAAAHLETAGRAAHDRGDALAAVNLLDRAARCEDYLNEAGNHPSGQAVILLHMAGLHAMQDNVARARAALNRAKTLLDTLGPTMIAAIIEPAAFVAMLTGDPATAEAHLRLQYESLSRMGEKDTLATTAALLARAIAAQGQSRYEEATRLITISREAGVSEDRSTQIIGQGLSARILAERGHHAEAEDLARSAAALAAQTDLLSERADALLDLAHVLAVAGRVPDAHAAAAEARELYHGKGNLPGARESLRCLARHADV